MIISLFGPDGVGKTTAAKRLGAELSLPVMNGSNMTKWRDLSWYQSFLDRGIDISTLTDSAHFEEMIRHAHQEAIAIDKTEGGVVLDSDPFHKVFIHQFLRRYIGGVAVAKMIERLQALAAHDERQPWIHVHMRLSQLGSPADHAAEMQRRIRARGDISPFDPSTDQASLSMMRSSELLDEGLRAVGHTVLTAYSDEPFRLPEVV